MTGRRVARNRYRFLLFAAAVVAGCTQGDRIAGGSGSTTTNGFTAVVRDDRGKAVAGAVVRVRPAGYCATGAVPPLSSGERSIADTVTGANGVVTLGGLRPGPYTIEIEHGAAGEGTIIRSDIDSGPIVDFGIQTTEPVGAISGRVDSTLLVSGAAFNVQVYGLERFAKVDPLTGAFLVAGLPPGNYAVRLVADDTAFASIDYDTITLASGDTVRLDPFDLWAHRATLTIDVALSGLTSGDTLVNFPLLLRLTRNNFDFSTAKKKGGDFRAVKNDGTFAAIDADWWDSANATAVIWILVDTLYGNRPQQTMNIFWGNGKILSVSRPNEVFDTTFGFGGVWHLNESGGTAQQDATVRNRDGVPRGMDGANDIPGLIGRAQRFDGDSTRIGFPAAAGLLTDGPDYAAMLSVWVKVTSASASVQGVISSSAPGFGIVFDVGNRWIWNASNAGVAADTLSAPATQNVWTHLTAIRRGETRYLYVNGVVVDSGSIGSQPAAADDPDSGFVLGCRPDGSGWLTGVVDELRMHPKAANDAWIRCCYETQREDQRAVSIERVR